MRATRTIPIVAGNIGDPVSYGIARSLARPGLNVTGLSDNSSAGLQLMVVLLRQAMPGFARLVAVFPEDEFLGVTERIFGAEMRRAGVESDLSVARRWEDVERILSRFDPARDAALVGGIRGIDYGKIVDLATRRRIVTTGFAGGGDDAPFLSVGMFFPDKMERIAALTAKVLRGANPAETPFEVATQSAITINRRVADALGLSLPPALLLRATRVIG